MRKVALVSIAVLALSTVACTPTPVDETYCQDIADVQDAVQQYADVDRVSVTNEVMEDLNEMGAQNRCPGYAYQQGDADG